MVSGSFPLSPQTASVAAHPGAGQTDAGPLGTRHSSSRAVRGGFNIPPLPTPSAEPSRVLLFPQLHSMRPLHFLHPRISGRGSIMSKLWKAFWPSASTLTSSIRVQVPDRLGATHHLGLLGVRHKRGQPQAPSGSLLPAALSAGSSAHLLAAPGSAVLLRSVLRLWGEGAALLSCSVPTVSKLFPGFVETLYTSVSTDHLCTVLSSVPFAPSCLN